MYKLPTQGGKYNSRRANPLHFFAAINYIPPMVRALLCGCLLPPCVDRPRLRAFLSRCEAASLFVTAAFGIPRTETQSNALACSREVTRFERPLSIPAVISLRVP